MTRNEAREWVFFHWTADDGGTDLDWERLLDAYLAIFARMPAEDEDAFATLSESDLAVKVGPGESLAPFRVDDPEAVAQALTRLAEMRG